MNYSREIIDMLTSELLAIEASPSPLARPQRGPPMAMADSLDSQCVSLPRHTGMRRF